MCSLGKSDKTNKQSELSQYILSMTEQTERRIKRSKFLSYFFSNILGHYIVYSGSRSEGVPCAKSDTDIMFEAQGVFVNILRIAKISKDKTTYLVMNHADVHPGYTKLSFQNDENVEDFSEFAIYGNGLKSLCPSGSTFVSNTLILNYWNFRAANILPDQRREHGLNFHGPCVLMAYTAMMKRTEVDITISFKSEWPTVADEWLLRHRKYNWPTADMINEIKAQGINLVPVGHAHSPNKDLEWRLSFSKAERLLVWSFSPVQRICMSLMKFFFSIKITPHYPDLFPSYFIKTAMFWMIEETESGFWNQENLLGCLNYLLGRLILYLENKKIDNYFIPTDNMMDAKPHDKLNSLMLELLTHKLSNDTVWMQFLELGMSTLDKNDIYHHHIQINCLSLSRFFIYSEIKDLDFKICLQHVERAVSVLKGTDIFPSMRALLISEINIIKTCLQFTNGWNENRKYPGEDMHTIENEIRSGCYLNNATGKLSFCTFILYIKQYQKTLKHLQEIEEEFTDGVIHYSFWERSKKPSDKDYDLSKPRCTFEETMKNFVALDVIVLPFLGRMYPESIQGILTAEKRVIFLHPLLYTKVLKFHCHLALQNHSVCQNTIEEMRRYSTMKQDASDLISENVITNCEQLARDLLADISASVQK